jgi:mono/diheme cytochrome c family protein
MKTPQFSRCHAATWQLAGIISLSLLAALVMVLLAAAQEAPPVPKTELNSLQGAAIFKQHCATCHGMDARGHGPMSVALKHPTPDLTRIAQRNDGIFPAKEVQEIVEGTRLSPSAHGNREMPVWGPIFHEIEWDRDLGNVRIEAITKYLETLQQK